jgi:aminocarboxymuconate-semialdehyde decarboxylase
MTPEAAALTKDVFDPTREAMLTFSSAITKEVGRKQEETIRTQLTSVEQRIKDMDRMGIDIQALSVAPPQYYYWADPELAERLARMQNEHLAELVEGHPDRFVGLATVPLQDVAASVRELDYCVGQLGFRGAEICTNVNGLDLDDPRFRPFFAKAQELDVVVVLHPHGYTQGERLMDYYLSNVIGNPLDSAVALTRIIFGGVLEELPNLKLCVVHGGGYLPFYSSRMDHAYHKRPEGRHHITRPPSSYLSQVYVDSVVYDAPHLKFLIEQMGADHVLLGTDYPYDMGHYDPLGQLDSVPRLSDEQRHNVRSATAAKLLKL